jgi:predicted dithiol-disulfide oxidoreductase (DUF899 family)
MLVHCGQYRAPFALHPRRHHFGPRLPRAPLAKIAPFKTRMDWTLPWYSSFASDFSYDFHVTTDQAVAPVDGTYNWLDLTPFGRQEDGGKEQARRRPPHSQNCNQRD